MAKITKFTGLNNVAVEYTSARPGDLQRANGVVIDNGGRIVRRNAMLELATGACRDVFVDGDTSYYVSGTSLMSNDGQTESELVQSLGAGKMRFWKVNDSVYYSNGTECGVIESGSVRSWGLSEPPVPTVASTVGQLVSATYIVALTYVRTNGMESGTSETVLCDVVDGGIAVTGITASGDPDVVGIAVYVSGAGAEALPDGSGLKLVTVLPNVNGSHTITDPASVDSGRVCKTFSMKRPPAPTNMFVYNGRMYYTLLNVMWYSPIFQWECADLDRAFLVVPTTIRVAAPTQAGIWVGTAYDFFFMSGKDPVAGGFAVIGKQGYGVSDAVVLVGSGDTQRRLTPGTQVLMVSERGLVLGDAAGTSMFLTDGVWKPTDLSPGQSAALDVSHGDLQFIFTTGAATQEAHAANVRTGAVTDFDFPVAVTGLGGSREQTLVATAGGVFYLGSGASDEGIGVVAAELWKLGLTFGTSIAKSITELYILMTCDGPYAVSTVAGDVESDGTTVSGVYGTSGAKYFKVKCARGLRAAALGFKFANSAGSMFRISEVEPVIDTSATRRGRQVIG